MSEEKFRYRVGFSIEERLALSILFAIYLIVTVWLCISGFEEVTSDALIPLVFIVLLGILAIASFHSYVGVYKGKCVYNRFFWKKTYKISEFGEPKEELRGAYVGHFCKVSVYVFYNVNGKRLFYVDTSRENAEKFYNEMKRHYHQVRSSARTREKKNKKISGDRV